MHNDQQQSFFNFIHPDHASLPFPVRTFWNSAAVLLFISPYTMAFTSCLGVVLGLDQLQAAWPALTRGLPLGVIELLRDGAIAVSALFLTGAFLERNELAQLIRNDIYETLENLQ
ncbi:hypothetical protein PQQ72_02010 [Paraburkholderia strydomiana]|uniref:hypothetical protein n=1 Tax=Paraburkholderia strydomiana TaxID=1245417 RepID=UPI0038B96C78